MPTARSAPSATPAAYLAALPPERRAVVDAMRNVVRRALPAGYEEQIASGMLAYVVPLTRHPTTYNKQPRLYVALAAQKHYYALYLTVPSSDPAHAEALRAGFARAGKVLDMGKSCVRFTHPDDLALDALAAEIASTPPDTFIALHEATRARQ